MRKKPARRSAKKKAARRASRPGAAAAPVPDDEDTTVRFNRVLELPGEPRLVRAVRDGLVALGCDEAPSRFGGDGVAFHRGRRELAHFHRVPAPGHELDLRLPRHVQRELRGDARVVTRPSRSDWVALRFASDADVEWLLALARHAWDFAGE